MNELRSQKNSFYIHEKRVVDELYNYIYVKLRQLRDPNIFLDAGFRSCFVITYRGSSIS